MKELFQNKHSCDVVLRVKDKDFLARKLILSARSSVFATLFKNEGNGTEVVVIDDLDPTYFSDFLLFIYCEEINLCCGNVLSILNAASKYNITDLRNNCFKVLKSNLTIDTFCDFLNFGLQNSEELVSHATSFFLENAKKIIHTNKWQSFVTENPIESNKLFATFVSSVHH